LPPESDAQLAAADGPPAIQDEVDPEAPAEAARKRGLLHDTGFRLDPQISANADAHVTRKSQGAGPTIAPRWEERNDLYGHDPRPAPRGAGGGQEIPRRHHKGDESRGETGRRSDARGLSGSAGSEGVFRGRYLVEPRGDTEVRGFARDPGVLRKALRRAARRPGLDRLRLEPMVTS